MPLVHTETMCWLTPHPTSPLLSMISAALCRSVQIESRMDEAVASRVGVYPPLPLVGKIPQQAEEETDKQRDRQTCRQADSEKEGFGCVSWLCPTLPQALSGFFWMVLWLLHSHTLYCASVLTDFFPPWHGHALCVAHTSLIGWLHRCLLSLSFLHKSTVWMIKRPWPQVSFVFAHPSSCTKAGKQTRNWNMHK